MFTVISFEGGGSQPRYEQFVDNKPSGSARVPICCWVAPSENNVPLDERGLAEFEVTLRFDVMAIADDQFARQESSEFIAPFPIDRKGWMRIYCCLVFIKSRFPYEARFAKPPLPIGTSLRQPDEASKQSTNRLLLRQSHIRNSAACH